MGRSGYVDDFDGENWSLICYRGAVKSAIRGKRGQAFLRELLAALDAMPVKRLVRGALEHDGEYCAMGVVCRARGLDMQAIDPSEPAEVAIALDIAPAMAKEIAFENDDDFGFNYNDMSPETRWTHMRKWAVENMREPNAEPSE